MTGTTEGGKKAAQTRGHDELSEAGRKGGQHSHGGYSQQQGNSGGGRGSNLTDEDGRKGGEHSRSGSRSNRDDE